MKKFLASLTAVVSVFGACAFVGCDKEETLDKMKGYTLTDSIFDMEISVKSASVTIIQDYEFYVESNVKNLTVEDDDGCLRIVEDADGKGGAKGEIRIYIPEVALGSVHIDMGAGNLVASYLYAYNLALTLGAGNATFAKLVVEDNTEIVGGTGKVVVSDGSIANLDYTLGVGSCAFAGEILGDSTIKCGVGALTLNLFGNERDYSLEIATGLGGATVNGQKVSDGALVGTGKNFVDIVGGVGAVVVNFVERNGAETDED
jgi:hypothetical protein